MDEVKPDQLYSEKDACELLNLRMHVLQRLRRDGKIASVSISAKTFRYFGRDLIAFVAAHRNEARA